MKQDYFLNIDIKLNASKYDVDELMNTLVELLDEIDFKHSFKGVIETSTTIG